MLHNLYKKILNCRFLNWFFRAAEFVEDVVRERTRYATVLPLPRIQGKRSVLIKLWFRRIHVYSPYKHQNTF